MGQHVLCFSKNIYEFQSLKQAWQFETVQNVVRSLKSNMYKYLSMFLGGPQIGWLEAPTLSLNIGAWKSI